MCVCVCVCVCVKTKQMGAYEITWIWFCECMYLHVGKYIRFHFEARPNLLSQTSAINSMCHAHFVQNTLYSWVLGSYHLFNAKEAEGIAWHLFRKIENLDNYLTIMFNKHHSMCFCHHPICFPKPVQGNNFLPGITSLDNPMAFFIFPSTQIQTKLSTSNQHNSTRHDHQLLSGSFPHHSGQIQWLECPIYLPLCHYSTYAVCLKRC